MSKAETRKVQVELDVAAAMKDIDVAISNLVSSIKKTSSQALKDTFNEMSSTIKQGVQQSEKALGSALSSMKNTVQKSYKEIQGALAEGQKQSVSKMTTTISSLKESATALLSAMKNASTNIHQKITQTMQENHAKAQTNEESNGNKAPPTDTSYLDNISKQLGSVKENFSSVTDTITKLSPQLGEAMAPFVDTITTGMDAALGFLNNITGWLTAFEGLQTQLPDLLNSMQGLFDVILNSPIGPFVLIAAALAALFVLLYQNNEEFRNSVNALVSDFVESLEPGIQVIMDAFNNLWNNALVPLYNTFMDFCNVVIKPLAAVLADVFAIAIKVVFDILKSLWNNILVPLATFFMDTFSKVIQAVIEIWNAWKPKIQMVMDIFMMLWNTVLKPLVNFITGIFTTALDSVFKTIGDVINNVKGIFSGIIDFVTGVFTGNWRKAWQGVQDIFHNIFGALGNIIKMPLNLVIDIVNKGIDGINSIGFDLPGWLGGGHFGLNIPNIPPLARGGIIDQPTLALVGESGKEAVMPLERNTGWIENLAMKLQSEMNTTGNGRCEELLMELLYAVKSLNLNIDGKKAVTMFKASKKELAMLK